MRLTSGKDFGLVDFCDNRPMTTMTYITKIIAFKPTIASITPFSVLEKLGVGNAPKTIVVISVVERPVGPITPIIRRMCRSQGVEFPTHWQKFHAREAERAAARHNISGVVAADAVVALARVGARTDQMRHHGPDVASLVATRAKLGSSGQFARLLKATVKRHKPLGRSLLWATSRRRLHLALAAPGYLEVLASVPFSVARGLTKLSPYAQGVACAYALDVQYDRAALRPAVFWPAVHALLARPISQHPAVAPGLYWVKAGVRVPSNVAVRRMGREWAAHLAGKERFWFKAIKALGPNPVEHDLIAATKLVAWLGEQAAGFVARLKCSQHDAGINLPLVVAEARPLLARITSTERLAEVLKVIENWQDVLAQGINPLAKDGVDAALRYLRSRIYSGSISPEFAAEAASHGVGQAEFSIWQQRWLAGLKALTQQSVPAPKINADGASGCSLVQLDKSDPRALFAGIHTGCCQHPAGDGASCAWHAHESPNGAIWAVFAPSGRMVAQAWVWRDGQALCLDNIEAGALANNPDMRQAVVRLFQQAAQAAIGRLGIGQVLLGQGYMDGWLGSAFAGFTSAINPLSKPANCYTDAHRVWALAGQGVGA
jgi:hypothetical protein